MILVTGGARSGKSAFAQRLAGAWGGRVLYAATAEAKDEEMDLRIRRHRAARPGDWGTLEVPRDAVVRLRSVETHWDILLFDCLTFYLSNLVLSGNETDPDFEVRVMEHLTALADYLSARWYRSIVVTNEVGSGLVPAARLSRIFRDMQGWANQYFAQKSEQVYLCVCGLPVCIKNDESDYNRNRGL